MWAGVCQLYGEVLSVREIGSGLVPLREHSESTYKGEDMVDKHFSVARSGALKNGILA